MRTGRPKKALLLTPEEQQRLQSLAHRARSQPMLARRARVILASAEGLSNQVVARKLRVSPGMVVKWRSRFLKGRLEGLYTAPSPSLPGVSQVPRSDRSPSATLEVHIIMDNYGTHKTALIRKWFAKRPRFRLHFTPTYSSWINLVERWFAELTNKRIRRGVFRSLKELEAAIRKYIEVHNEAAKPFVWTKTADQILDSIARYAKRTLAATT